MAASHFPKRQTQSAASQTGESAALPECRPSLDVTQLFEVMLDRGADLRAALRPGSVALALLPFDLPNLLQAGLVAAALELGPEEHVEYRCGVLLGHHPGSE